MTFGKPHAVLSRALIVLLLSFTCSLQAVAQETAVAAPTGETKNAEAEATLFPVPDFASDIWTRAKLTGDWGGLRGTMARNGVQLDVDNVHTFQAVTSGGLDTTGRYLGNAEIVLKLDSQKMGLWPGGFLLVRGEAAFGTGVNSATGALLPVNTRPILSLPARDEMVLSHVVFTQFLSEKFAVALGVSCIYLPRTRFLAFLSLTPRAKRLARDSTPYLKTAPRWERKRG